MSATTTGNLRAGAAAARTLGAVELSGRRGSRCQGDAGARSRLPVHSGRWVAALVVRKFERRVAVAGLLLPTRCRSRDTGQKGRLRLRGQVDDLLISAARAGAANPHCRQASADTTDMARPRRVSFIWLLPVCRTCTALDDGGSAHAAFSKSSGLLRLRFVREISDGGRVDLVDMPPDRGPLRRAGHGVEGVEDRDIEMALLDRAWVERRRSCGGQA